MIQPIYIVGDGVPTSRIIIIDFQFCLRRGTFLKKCLKKFQVGSVGKKM